MPTITLPDGSQQHHEGVITALDVAKTIGAGLAKAAIAAKVNGVLVDLSHLIDEDADITLVTAKDPEGVDIIRHSTAHLLAQAVKLLFPSAQVTIGPVIENGFYYDFAYERSFTPDDLQLIEAKMHALAKQDATVERTVMTRDQAIALFQEMGEEYKAKIIADIPSDEPLSLYRQDEFIDLCRGPHVPSVGKCHAFKLTKLAGAYWRGDSNNEMLQRIYGTAWPDKKALKAYLFRLEEAEKRDHRRIAKQMDLFHLQEEAPGMVFWHEKGWYIYQVIEQYMRDMLQRYDYQEIKTPQLAERILWEKSGHWDKYREEMLVTSSESRDFVIKPMNCPCHVQVFNHTLRSYRDLPIRYAEFGACHRNEPSGTLHGLMRVRGFVQDDAHIFCTEAQIHDEAKKLMAFVLDVYRDFGFNDVICHLSTRPEKRVGSDVVWDKAETALENVLNDSGLQWQICPGDGAFYGPKIDCILRDCLGRQWQCGTIQLDFSMPQRLEASYIAEDGSRQVPVMLHRAILGSIERFLGVLIEQFAGKFPPWLAPIQVVVLNLTDRNGEYVQNITKILKNLGFRARQDLRNEKIGFKIREHTLQRVPYLLIVGDKEQQANSVSVRTLSGENLGNMSLEAFSQRLSDDIALKGRIFVEE